ncbi:MAG: hypothetical protein KUL84_15095, partial [Diaphorobacter sp.]|nr:hypothetical protein [Diaphorobacter sp.]
MPPPAAVGGAVHALARTASVRQPVTELALAATGVAFSGTGLAAASARLGGTALAIQLLAAP